MHLWLICFNYKVWAHTSIQSVWKNNTKVLFFLLERNGAIQHKTDQAGLEVSASRRSEPSTYLEGLLDDIPLSHACAYRAATHASVCRRILSARAQVKPQNSFLITIKNTSGGDSAPPEGGWCIRRWHVFSWVLTRGLTVFRFWLESAWWSVLANHFVWGALALAAQGFDRGKWPRSSPWDGLKVAAFWFTPALWVGDTGDFGMDLIPSKYKASIVDTNTNRFYLKCHDHWFILWICLELVDYDHSQTWHKDFRQMNKKIFSATYKTIQNAIFNIIKNEIIPLLPHAIISLVQKNENQ